LFRRLPRPSTIHPVGTRMPKEHTTSRPFRRWTKLLPGWISCRQPLYPHRPVEAVVLALGGRCRRARMRTHPATRYQTPHRLRELNLRNGRTSEPLRTLLSPLPIGPQFHTSLQRIRSTSGKNRPLPSPMNPPYTHTRTHAPSHLTTCANRAPDANPDDIVHSRESSLSRTRHLVSRRRTLHQP
jgi:hypothetical protein